MPAAGLAGLFVLAVTGCSGQGGTAAPAAGTSYAPYVSATTASGSDFAGSPTAYNLAFVVAGGGDCAPAWDGTRAVGDPSVASRISRLERDGADVRVSFGGASGTELAAACDSAPELAAAYGEALDAVGSSRADFDVEGDELTDPDSVALRSRAVALLQRERSGLEVTFTLPVMSSGLDGDALALLQSADDHGVRVSTVNLMTMNYGESRTGDMGAHALRAARAAHAQLKEVFAASDAEAWRGMALTPMIGVNDVAGETFTLADAARVRAFAEEKGIGWVSMWAAFRDRACEDGDGGGGDAGADGAPTDCSGVEQSPGAFGEALAG